MSDDPMSRAIQQIEILTAERDGLSAQYAKVREDYMAWWKAWLHDHQSVDLASWLRAYAKAMPETHPDDASSPDVQFITNAVDEKVTASADEIERVRAERDEARQEVLLWVKERCSWAELSDEIKKRGWGYLKEEGK